MKRTSEGFTILAVFTSICCAAAIAGSYLVGWKIPMPSATDPTTPEKIIDAGLAQGRQWLAPDASGNPAPPDNVQQAQKLESTPAPPGPTKDMENWWNRYHAPLRDMEMWWAVHRMEAWWSQHQKQNVHGARPRRRVTPQPIPSDTTTAERSWGPPVTSSPSQPYAPPRYLADTTNWPMHGPPGTPPAARPWFPPWPR